MHPSVHILCSPFYPSVLLQSCVLLLNAYFFSFLKLFLFPGSRTPSRGFTLCTIFGRMPGIEPELLRPQPGVLPMSYTHIFLSFSIFLSYCIFLSWCILLSCCILFTSFCPTAYFCPFASFCPAAFFCLSFLLHLSVLLQPSIHSILLFTSLSPTASFCPASILHSSIIFCMCGYAVRSRYPLPMRCGEACLDSLALSSEDITQSVDVSQRSN